MSKRLHGLWAVVSVMVMVAGFSVPALATGAIAVDDEAGSHPSDVGWGIGTGGSRAAAEAEALRQCRKAGNRDCTVVVYYEQCGAYAVSSGHFGVGWGSSIRVAENAALNDCGGGCRVVVSECD